MADTVMTVRLVAKELARPGGHPRQLHAQAPGRRAGIGHAHAPVALGGRAQRLHRRGAPLRPLADRAPVHRRAPAPCPRDHGGHQPVGQLLQATGERLRGAHQHQLGPQQPLGPRAGAGREAEQDGVDPGRVPGPRQRLQPVSRLRGDPGRRAARHRGRLRAPARGRRQPLRAVGLGAGGQGDRPVAEHARTTRSTRWSAPRCWPTRWATTSSSGSCATSGPSGPPTGPRSASSSSTATSRCYERPARRPGRAGRSPRG